MADQLKPPAQRSAELTSRCERVTALAVETQVDVGSTFTVCLPAAQSVALTPPQPSD